MIDQLSYEEQSVRDVLILEAADVPDRETIRRHILSSLEGEPVIRALESPRKTKRVRRAVPVSLRVAAAVVLCVVVIQGLFRGPVDLTTSDAADLNLPAASEAVGRDNLLGRYDTETFLRPLTLEPTPDASGFWRVHSESERLLSLEFGDKAQASDGSRRLVHIAAPPPGTTAQEVVDAIESTLFDTEIVSDGSDSIGGLNSRLLRLQTAEGTSHLAFRLASDIYIEADGIDRSFAVHIIDSGPQMLVFWVEAHTGEIDEFERTVGRLVSSLNLG